MKIASKHSSGFTMVEIAFSLAIVAFALVAIMGVLPTGMTVQKDNREDTIINNDAAFWIEAIRSGSKGLDDLTNYVEEIRIDSGKSVFRITNSFDAQSQIVSGQQIIGLLTTPKYVKVSDTETVTNIVTARVRAINGPAIEKGNPKNEFTFRYELRSEVTANLALPDTYISDSSTVFDRTFNTVVTSNLYHLRLNMRWPMFQQGDSYGVGRNRRTMRALINGKLAGTNEFFVQPNRYEYVAY